MNNFTLLVYPKTSHHNTSTLLVLEEERSMETLKNQLKIGLNLIFCPNSELEERKNIPNLSIKALGSSASHHSRRS